jgi:two-component system chemotaxis response regulator CheY
MSQIGLDETRAHDRPTEARAQTGFIIWLSGATAMVGLEKWAEPRYDISGISMLICEPNKHMQILVEQVLRTFGVTAVRFADDAADALGCLRQGQFDLLMTEYRMDLMDGFELVQMVRTAADSANPFIPIIMLTGHTEARYIHTARDFGVTEFLAKPITPVTLYKRIVTLIEKPRPFVKSRTYFGPERRRQTSKTFKGPDRRSATDGLSAAA